MRLLLDTHALLWWFLDDPKLGVVARQSVADQQNTVFVSPVSVWEIAWKVKLGKLSQAVGLDEDLLVLLQASGFEPLPITNEHVLAAALLPSPHRDPFDRILAAQCAVEDLILVSLDLQMVGLGATLLW